MVSMQDVGTLYDRALIAWLKRARHDGYTNRPDPRYSGVVQHDGKEYVVLYEKAMTEPFMVYRIRKHDGRLKALKRWPSELHLLDVLPPENP